MNPVFELGVDQQNSEAVITLRGELDIATSERLDAALRQAQNAGTRLIVLDLSDVSFIDSMGLRTVLLADRRTREAGARLVLVRPQSEDVTRLFEISGVGRLRFADTPSEALAG